MVDYGCEAWKDYNDVLQDMVNKLQNRFRFFVSYYTVGCIETTWFYSASLLFKLYTLQNNKPVLFLLQVNAS